MKQRGFTLAELLVSLTLLVSVSGTVAVVTSTMYGREEVTRAYAADLSSLRRAARVLQQDLRAAHSLADVDVRLESGALKRGTRVLLSRVHAFDLTAEGPLAHVRLVLAPRSRTATREAAVEFDVRMRRPAPEGPR